MFSSLYFCFVFGKLSFMDMNIEIFLCLLVYIFYWTVLQWRFFTFFFHNFECLPTNVSLLNLSTSVSSHKTLILSHLCCCRLATSKRITSSSHFASKNTVVEIHPSLDNSHTIRLLRPFRVLISIMFLLPFGNVNFQTEKTNFVKLKNFKHFNRTLRFLNKYDNAVA